MNITTCCVMFTTEPQISLRCTGKLQLFSRRLSKFRAFSVPNNGESIVLLEAAIDDAEEANNMLKNSHSQ